MWRIFPLILLAIFLASCAPYTRTSADQDCRKYAYAMYAEDDAQVRYVECIRLNEKGMKTR